MYWKNKFYKESVMKTIGLIGGLAWQSTVYYYKIINEMVAESLGGRHSASLLIRSLDFHPIDQMMKKNEWDKIIREITCAAQILDREGVSYILICCNTIHKIADAISKSLHNAELINIIDVVAEAIHLQNMTKVGLLGSIYTMEEPFYKERLSNLHKVKTLIPNSEERKLIMHIIETELGKGEINLQSRKSFLKIIDDLVQRGAEGVILGCTEIPLLISQKDTQVPLFDSTYLHAKAAVDLALR